MSDAATPSMLPVLRGRVTLRRLRPADLADFQAYRSDPELGRYQGWQPMPDAQALAFLQQVADEPLLQPGEWSQIAIADPASDRLLGDIGLFIADALAHAEIGFTLARPLHGRGLATEAVNAAIGLVFQHRAVPRIIGITDARNAASCRLLERVGMARVSTDEAVFRGEPCLEHTYALDRPSAADAAPQTVAAAVQALVLYSLAEHQGGGARTVRVTVAGDAFSVSDDGRGHAIDKTIDGVSYLRFVYTHFEHPFGLAQAPPVQLQGIGLSLLNALCSTFSVTVHKRDATLHLQFLDGRLTSRHRADAASPDSGLHIAGRVQAALCGPSVPLQGLRQWLQGVQAASPSLRLVFNGEALSPPDGGPATPPAA